MKKYFAWHPLLFVVFPILSLYNHNKDMAQLSYLLRPLIIALFSAEVIYLFLFFITKNRNKSALLTSFFALIFLSFGHILPAISNLPVGAVVIYNHYILLALTGVLFAASAFLIISAKGNFQVATTFLNAMAAILVLVLVGNIGYYELRTKNYIDRNALGKESALAGASAAATAQSLPDIYYVILDGYARADVLNRTYGYDNGEFLDYLRGRGFYIADQSHANYAQTYLSISSSLNFDYLDNLIPADDHADHDRRLARQLIKNSRVYETLKENGYKLIAFPSIWAGYNDNLNADIKYQNSLNLNEFDNLLLSATPLYGLFSRNAQLSWVRDKFEYTLDHLPDLALRDEPTFAYVHLLSPHPPFLYDRSGNPIEPKMDVIGNDGSHYFNHAPGPEELAAYRQKYIDQLIYLNGRIENMLDELLEKSDRSPIIILQSDHGPGSLTDWESIEKTDLPERLSNLNAYLLPTGAKSKLYPTITPVNSFRLVFNEIFRLNLPLLDDRSYFSTWSHPYDYVDVTSRLAPESLD